MAKVTVHETPTQSIVKAANQTGNRQFGEGRIVGIKKMLPLDRLKMFEVIGPENSKNEPYLGYAALAFHVASLDGEPVNRPATKLQLEALIQRLGDDGMEAVGEAVQEMFAANAQGDGMERIKN